MPILPDLSKISTRSLGKIVVPLLRVRLCPVGRKKKFFILFAVSFTVGTLLEKYDAMAKYTKYT
jgi:hypothetical protein